MATLLNWYCQLFGYGSCSEASTFEALALFGILILIGKAVWLVIDVAIEVNSRRI
jgi:hypothetical protein